ncbi:Alpha/Beta hydrolase protein, partial [Mycena olivaceomarginata]
MKLLLSASLAALISSVLGADNLTVKTSTGTYTGLIDSNFPNTRQFRSVAFAEPPVTARRWLPPTALSKSAAHHYSNNFPPLVPAVRLGGCRRIHTRASSGEATSEDCLYLAVWTPAKLPPRQSSPSYSHDRVAGCRRAAKHIVVTINYRLNIFGFPKRAGLAAQNLGILDQRMALDTDIHSHAFYADPIARGYFPLQSGNRVHPSGPRLPLRWTPPTLTSPSFARHFGCAFPADADPDGAAELDCMRPVPFAQIEKLHRAVRGPPAGSPPSASMASSTKKIIFADYPARAAAGKIARVPTIISNCANEMSSLTPTPCTTSPRAPTMPAVLGADLALWVCPTATSTALRNAHGIPVFRYQNAGTFPNLNPAGLGWLGAYHAGDLPTVFGTYGLLTDLGKTTAFEVAVSRAMQDHVLAFVKDPARGPQSVGWAPLNASASGGGTLIRFGADGKVVQNVDGVEVDGPCNGIGTYDQFP